MRNLGESPWDEKSFLMLSQECERLWLLHSTAQRTLSGSLCGESEQARLLWEELDADLQSLPLRCSEGVNQLRQS